MSSSPEFRYNPIEDRWIILAPERSTRPQITTVNDSKSPDSLYVCPFCPGREHLAPIELLRLGTNHEAGWTVRGIANRYPMLRVEGDVSRSAVGPYGFQSGVGAHEVIVETPNHQTGWHGRPTHENQLVLTAWRLRLMDLARDRRLVHFQTFSNVGKAAGATLEHPHSQVVASSIVPSAIVARVQRQHKYWAQTGRCLFCDVLDFESTKKDRIVAETTDLLAFCPYASVSPFSILFAPKRHESRFTLATDQETMALANLMSTVLSAYSAAIGDTNYNLILHSAPHESTTIESTSGEVLNWNRTHWYIEVVSRYITTGGYELSTGAATNDTPPEDVAAHLRALLARRGT